MEILVIGGTGFISGRMVEMLLERGHHVALFTRGHSTRSFREEERLERLRGDRRSRTALEAAVRGRTFDAIFDMVAYAAEDSQVAVEVFRGRTGHFIHCSTISVYMISNEIVSPVTEDQDRLPVMPHWPRNPFGMDYGVGKRECEEILWRAHDEREFPVTMLRPTYVNGPADVALRDYFWIQRILDGAPLLIPGSGDFAFHPVYIDDVARAFVDVLEAPSSVGRAYNVAAEEVYSLNEYLDRLSTLLARDVERVHIDQEVFDALPISTHPRGDVFPFNTRRTAIFSLDRIRKEVGYVSTPFEKAMGKTIDWYLNEFDSDSIGYEHREREVELARAWSSSRSSLLQAFRSAV